MALKQEARLGIELTVSRLELALVSCPLRVGHLKLSQTKPCKVILRDYAKWTTSIVYFMNRKCSGTVATPSPLPAG